MPMVKCSYYLTREFADRLAFAVDDLHFGTRRGKFECLEAVIEVRVTDLDAVEARLRARS